MIIPWNAVVIASVAALSFGSGALVTHWKHDSDELRDEQALQQSRDFARELMSESAAQTAAAIGGIRVENRTIYQQGRVEILREPVYSECLVPVAGVELLTKARAAGSDRSDADAAVPANSSDTDNTGR